MAQHRVPPQQQHTIPGLGVVGPPEGGGGGGGGRSGGSRGSQRRGNERAAPRHGGRPGHEHEPRQVPRRAPQQNSPAPAPVPGLGGKVPYQQQHEVPGLNLAGGGAGELGNGPARRSNSTTPQYGRRAELTANQDSEMQGGGGAAAALGIGGNWDQNTFPKEYHAKPANRAPPDAGQMLKNARHDPNMPAVGEMLQQAERELAQKQLELDRLAQEMGEQGSRGIVAGHFGRNATTQAASHTGGVAATYLNREAGEPSSRDGGGGSGGGGAGRVAGVRDDKGGQGGVAGFDTMDLKREGLGHNFGRVNRMREPESDAGKALNHVGYTPTWKASQGQPRPSPAALAAVSDYPGWHNSEASRPQHVGRGGFTTGGQENEVDAPRNGGGGGGGGGGPGTERKNGGKQMSGILGGDWQGGGTEHRLAPQLYELHPGVSVPVERPMHGGALAGGNTHNSRNGGRGGGGGGGGATLSPAAARAGREAAETAADARRRNQGQSKVFF